jgi:hypothetical protein
LDRACDILENWNHTVAYNFQGSTCGQIYTATEKLVLLDKSYKCLRVFENRVLKEILGPKRDENGEWRRSNH